MKHETHYRSKDKASALKRVTSGEVQGYTIPLYPESSWYLKNDPIFELDRNDHA